MAASMGHTPPRAIMEAWEGRRAGWQAGWVALPSQPVRWHAGAMYAGDKRPAAKVGELLHMFQEGLPDEVKEGLRMIEFETQALDKA